MPCMQESGKPSSPSSMCGHSRLQCHFFDVVTCGDILNGCCGGPDDHAVCEFEYVELQITRRFHGGQVILQVSYDASRMDEHFDLPIHRQRLQRLRQVIIEF